MHYPAANIIRECHTLFPQPSGLCAMVWNSRITQQFQPSFIHTGERAMRQRPCKRAAPSHKMNTALSHTAKPVRIDTADSVRVEVHLTMIKLTVLPCIHWQIQIDIFSRHT